MSSVNRVILIGRLGRDPETRYLNGGQAVANFSVATDETYREVGANQRAHQYPREGSLIFIEGRIQSRHWQDKAGQKRISFGIVAAAFRLLYLQPYVGSVADIAF